MSSSTHPGKLSLGLSFKLILSQSKISALGRAVQWSVGGTRSVGKSETIPRLAGLQDQMGRIWLVRAGSGPELLGRQNDRR